MKAVLLTLILSFSGAAALACVRFSGKLTQESPNIAAAPVPAQQVSEPQKAHKGRK